MQLRQILHIARQNQLCLLHNKKPPFLKCYHGVPFIEFYQRITGESVSEIFYTKIKKRHPNIEHISHDRLQCILHILQKFNITALDACHDIHVFNMNPITLDNYGEILKECGFIRIAPKHIIRYHTIVRSRTIAQLKKEGLLHDDIRLEKLLQDCFPEWPASLKVNNNYSDSDTNILSVRMDVLKHFLKWKLRVTSEDFNKYIRNYLPLKHKPMSDIKEAINIAENNINLTLDIIRKNGFIVAADPINTKLILENVSSIAGLDVREAIKLEPAIMKNNYNSLLKIRSILEEYRISDEIQRKNLKVYCMCPDTVKERLDELKGLKQYQILKTNPRMLSLVVHKNKMLDRINKINQNKKQCYSLNHLVASSKVFNNYISSFGSKVCGKDLAILISSSLQLKEFSDKEEFNRHIIKQLKRHKYWLHSALNVIDDNIQFLKQRFDDRVIFNNCQLLLYPTTEIEQNVNFLLHLRNTTKRPNHLDANYNSVNCQALNDEQLLSLVLYEIEKKYHFSCDGIWAGHDNAKADSRAS